MRSEGLWESADGSAGNDERLFVRFHMGTVQDAVASSLAGCPKFKDVAFVTIAVPGDKSVVIDRPVWDDENNPKSDTQRFPRAWAAFKAGHGDDIQSGTPLSEWAAVTRAQVEDMAFHKIRTVEQLAGLTDGNAQKFLGSTALRQKARDWLVQSEKARPFAAIRKELEDKDEQMASLRQELQSLRAAMTEGRVPEPEATSLSDVFAEAAQAAEEEPKAPKRVRSRKEASAP